MYSNVFPAEDQLYALEKRNGVDFMGMRVSYPQYLRLVAIQREVIRMDQTIRHMLNTYDAVELAQNPHWMELLELYDSLRKMLPPDYLERMGNSPAIPPQLKF